MTSFNLTKNKPQSLPPSLPTMSKESASLLEDMPTFIELTDVLGNLHYWPLKDLTISVSKKGVPSLALPHFSPIVIDQEQLERLLKLIRPLKIRPTTPAEVD